LSNDQKVCNDLIKAMDSMHKTKVSDYRALGRMARVQATGVNKILEFEKYYGEVEGDMGIKDVWKRFEEDAREKGRIGRENRKKFERDDLLCLSFMQWNSGGGRDESGRLEKKRELEEMGKGLDKVVVKYNSDTIF
jgi:hypothetical protein